MSRYPEDPEWADVVPLPIDEGGPNPLAAIAYSDEYEEVSSYLRAIMAANEYTERALALTEDMIDLNTAHYTAWLYRAQCLFHLQADLRQELVWLNEIALAHQKNYQIWHHRNLIVDKLDSAVGETEFIEEMFALDAKNYHVWSYRQWLVKRFALWDQGELEFVDKMLDQDIRNNSAWNHRWFIVNARQGEGVHGVKNVAIRDREIEYAKSAIRKAPQNQSPWNYLRGIISSNGMSPQLFQDFAAEFASVDSPDSVRSSHALDMLAEAYAADASTKGCAVLALDLLSHKYDPIRKNYWEYKKQMLGLVNA